MIAAEKNGEPVLAADFWAAAGEAESNGQDKKAWVDANRPDFICPVCGAKASFVSPGTGRWGGNPPHFRVTGVSSCNNHSSSGWAERAKADSALKEGIINVGGLITIRYDPLIRAGGGPATSGDGIRAGAGVARNQYVDGGGTPSNRETAGLVSFLSDLRSMQKFPPSTLRLKVAGRGQVWGKDYFRRFEDATAEDVTPCPDEQDARLMAFWGEIKRANADSSALFLNGENVGIMLDNKHKPVIQAKLGLEEFKDLNGQGWYVIAEGRLAENRYKNGFYLKLSDLSRIAFIKP